MNQVNLKLILCAFGFHKYNQWNRKTLQNGLEMSRSCKRRCGRLEQQYFWYGKSANIGTWLERFK